MCKETEPKRAIDLSDPRAHDADHRHWSRRNFLSASGMLTAGSFLFDRSLIRTFMPSPLLASLANSETDRVLVLVRLDGGNDSLNMVIERGNDLYYSARPTIAIPDNNLWAMSPEYGMPLTTSALQPMWDNGMMKAVFNVGYPQPNFSHFRSYDIIATGSASDEYLTTGWLGRFLDNQYPAYLEAPPTVPPALQIGVRSNLIFRSDVANMALAVNSPQEFYQIASSGQLYNTSGLGNTAHELELAFMRQTANSAFRYAATVKDAYFKGANTTDYQANNDLAEQMSIVARLIKGNLGTKIYLVQLGGFDTHAEQADSHPVLMNKLSSAISAFYTDLAEAGMGDKVLTMTFSEFGRTIYENGSFGTDHGRGTHSLLFGGGLGSGFEGTYQDLSNPNFSVDFRNLYATILQDWLGSEPDMIRYVMGQPFDPINGLVPATTPPIGTNAEEILLGHHPHQGSTDYIDIKYSLSRAGDIRLDILSTSGEPLRQLTQGYREQGSHIYILDKAALFLTPGEYRYRLTTGGRTFERKLLL